MNSGVWIPVVAIVTSVTVPIIAILADFRRRKLQYEERRLMIERGMTPPPLEEHSLLRPAPEERRERALRGGIVMLCIGLGLGLGAFLLAYVFTASHIPGFIVGMMALGASVVGFIGIGNLVYYGVTAKRRGALG